MQKNDFNILIIDGASLNKFNSAEYNMLITNFKNNDSVIAEAINSITPHWLIVSAKSSMMVAAKPVSKMVYTTAGAGSIKIIMPAEPLKIKVEQLTPAEHIWR